MFIDTHCHLDSYERYSGESLSALLERLPHDADPKVTLPEAFIHVACDPADFEYARELSEKYPNIYTAYGIHPEYVLTETAEDEARMMENRSNCLNGSCNWASKAASPWYSTCEKQTMTPWRCFAMQTCKAEMSMSTALQVLPNSQDNS